MQLEFKIGDKAVCPGHGVGQVMGVKSETVAGQTVQFYVIHILDSGVTQTQNSMVMLVPTSAAGKQRLRGIITLEETEAVYTVLRTREPLPEAQTWNRRYREYTEKIKTGSPREIARVMRDLSLLKQAKDLSFGERKLLDTARLLLVKELAIARDKTEEQIEVEIAELLGINTNVLADTVNVGTPEVTAAPARNGKKKPLAVN